jgi:hypothetical protein
MRRHRTTARGILLLALLGLAAGPAAAHPVAKRTVPQLIFPVLGPATYIDDFSHARGNGRHGATDIMAPRKAIAVAAEAGTVKFWTTSWRAGCMLYLHGRSGTTYLYIHLNNDLGNGNDNTGACVPGVAYAPGLKNGAKVAAGEPVGFVGDSGDADGGAPHLHFEIRPGGGGEVNPFPYLNKARKLLFAGKPGSTFRLTLQGKVVTTGENALALRVEHLRRFPGGLTVPKVNRTVRLTVPPEAVVFNPVGAVIRQAQLLQARPGQSATVWTQPGRTTLQTQLGAPNTISAERVALLGPLPEYTPG